MGITAAGTTSAGAGTGKSSKLAVTDVATECDTTSNTSGLSDEIIPDCQFNGMSSLEAELLSDAERISGDCDRNFDCELEIIDDSIDLDSVREKRNILCSSPSRCKSPGRGCGKYYCRKECFRGQVVPCQLDISVSSDMHGGKGAEDVEHGGKSYLEFTRYFNISGDKKAEIKKSWNTFWENNTYSRRKIGKHQKQGDQRDDRGKPGKHGVIQRDDLSVACGDNVSHERVTMPLLVSQNTLYQRRCEGRSSVCFVGLLLLLASCCLHALHCRARLFLGHSTVL